MDNSVGMVRRLASAAYLAQVRIEGVNFLARIQSERHPLGPLGFRPIEPTR